VSSGNIRKDAYILKFINDTTFSLPTSVNYAGGKYVIASNGNVRINYNISTEICCENNFDEQMINVINKVNTYYCKGNELTFLTKENEKIIFEKQ
jgi:heat shock protein HslJ